MVAGAAMDKLADEYAGQGVLFLEYDVDHAEPSRYSRWWAAYQANLVTLPLMMVDSGNQISNGNVDYYNVYKGMVEASRIRPPKATIEAATWRNGNKVGFYVQLINQSGVTLSPSNSATVHAIVYEDIHVADTDSYVREAITAVIPSLAPNETGTFILETAELSGVNWNNLHFVVLADYRPSGSGAYDTLQAVQASMVRAPFEVAPNPLTFLIDPEDPTNTSTILTIKGANFLTWTATEDIPWLTLTPTNGPVNAQPVVSVDTALLSPKVQQGVITFITDDNRYTIEVIVRAYYGHVEHNYLILIER